MKKILQAENIRLEAKTITPKQNERMQEKLDMKKMTWINIVRIGHRLLHKLQRKSPLPHCSKTGFLLRGGQPGSGLPEEHAPICDDPLTAIGAPPDQPPRSKRSRHEMNVMISQQAAENDRSS